MDGAKAIFLGNQEGQGAFHAALHACCIISFMESGAGGLFQVMEEVENKGLNYDSTQAASTVDNSRNSKPTSNAIS